MRYLIAASPRTLFSERSVLALAQLDSFGTSIPLRHMQTLQSLACGDQQPAWATRPWGHLGPPAPGYAHTGYRESPHPERSCRWVHKPDLALPKAKAGSKGPLPMFHARCECSAWDNMSPSAQGHCWHNATPSGQEVARGQKCQQKHSCLSTLNCVDWF